MSIEEKLQKLRAAEVHSYEAYSPRQSAPAPAPAPLPFASEPNGPMEAFPYRASRPLPMAPAPTGPMTPMPRFPGAKVDTVDPASWMRFPKAPSAAPAFDMAAARRPVGSGFNPQAVFDVQPEREAFQSDLDALRPARPERKNALDGMFQEKPTGEFTPMPWRGKIFEEQEQVHPDDQPFLDKITGLETQREAARAAQEAAINGGMKPVYDPMLEGYTEQYVNQADVDKYRQQMEALDLEIGRNKAELEQQRATRWEQKQRRDIIKTGGKELLHDILLIEKNRNEGKGDFYAPYAAYEAQLREKYGDQFKNWMDYAKRLREEGKMDELLAQVEQEAREHPFWSTIGSTPANLLSGGGMISSAFQQAKNKLTGRDVPINYNTAAFAPGKVAATQRGTVSGMIADTWAGQTGANLYNLGTSMLDSAAVVGLQAIGVPTAVGSSLLGASAGNSAMLDAKERGASDGEALMVGLLAAAAETGAEKLSLDELLSPNMDAKKWQIVMRQSGVELTEEASTALANTVADRWIMDGRDTVSTEMRELMDGGMSQEDAKNKAVGDWAKGVAMDAVGGGISGGFMAGTGVVFRDAAAKIDQAMQKHKSKQAQNITQEAPTAPEPPKPQQTVFEEAMETVLKDSAQKPQADPFDGVVEAAVKPETEQKPVEVAEPVKPEPVKAPTVSKMETAWNDFMSKHNGKPTEKDFNAFMEGVWASGEDPVAVSTFLEAQEQAGNIKFHSDGSFYVPTGTEMDIDGRDFASVGSPKVNAIQYDNPELRPYFEDAAQMMGEELERSNPGERFWNGESGIDSRWTGTKRNTIPQVAQFKDDYHLGWDAVHKAVSDILEDKGRENNANAKRMELILDDLMTNGYRSMDGRMIPPNRAYIEAKGGDPDAKPSSGIDEDFWRNEFGEDMNVPTNEERSAVQPNPTETENTQTGGEGEGDMGAKTSNFRHEVKMGKGSLNTLDEFENQRNVPQENKVQNQPFGEYTVRHMDEVVHNADLRLQQDYDGEVEALENAINWTDEEVAMSKAIADNLLREARQTGDFSKYNKWMKGVRERQTTGGQSVNAWKLYKKNTYEGIMKEASELLENAKPGTDTDAIMEAVAQFAEKYDAAVKAGEAGVDQLVSLIKDTARQRRTGTMFKNRFPKEAEWALNRIAEYAKQNVRDAAENAQGTAEPTSTNFKVGDVVKANDRGNYGKIESISDDGVYSVHFRSRDGHEATVKFDREQLEAAVSKQVTASDIASDPGAAFEFLKGFAASGIKDIAGDTNKSSLIDKALDIRRNAMLSKISTIFRNLVGNGVFDPVDSLSTNLAVLLDTQLAKKTGTRSTAVDKSWLSQEKRKGSMDGLAMAIMEVALDVDASGTTSKYDTPSNRTFKMNEGTGSVNDVLNRVFSVWDKHMGYALTVPDEFQKGGIQSETQRGLDKLYEQGKIKDDSLRDGGTEMAKYRTFQGDSYFSNAISGIRRALNGQRFPTDKSNHIGELAIPFAQVPANLASISMDYSPVGLAKGIADVAKVWKAANDGTLTAAQQAKAVQEVGRGVNGTMLIAMFAALARAGILHVVNPGNEDENKDKSAIERMQGHSGTQLNLDAAIRWAQGGSSAYQDGDKLVQIGFLDPINAQMTTGALVAETLENETLSAGEKAGRSAANSIEGTLQAVLDLPVMSTLKSAQMAYQQSDKATSGGKALDAGLDFLASQATSFIPNALKGAAEAVDPYQRDAYSGDTVLERARDKAKLAIPGKYGRESLPVKLDSFGNPIKNDNDFQRVMNSSINPGRITDYHTDETMEGLNRLNRETGSDAIYPGRKPPTHFNVDGKDVELTDQQQRDYQQFRGNLEADNRRAIFRNERYNNLPNDLKLKIQSRAEALANALAKGSLGVGYELSETEKELQGMSPDELAEYFVDDVLIEAKNEELRKAGETEDVFYRAMNELLGSGKIDEEAVLDRANDSFVGAYNEFLKPNDIDVAPFLELYATLSDMPGEYNSDKKEAALDFLEGMELPQEDVSWIGQALYDARPDIFKTGDKPGKDWLIEVGTDDSVLYDRLGEKQESYDKYLKGSGVTASEFTADLQAKESMNATETQTVKEQYITYLDNKYGKDNRKKVKVWLATGYKSDPPAKWWK